MQAELVENETVLFLDREEVKYTYDANDRLLSEALARVESSGDALGTIDYSTTYH
jgi:hypothetical protein